MATDRANGSREPPERIILDGVVYEPVNSLLAPRQLRSQVSMYTDWEIRGMSPYKYNRLLSMHRGFRLVRLHGGGLFDPQITCELFDVEYDRDDQNIVRMDLGREERIRRGRGHARRTAPNYLGGSQDLYFDGAIVEYEALSWCWGQGVKDYAIKIQEGASSYRLAVTRDLVLALKYLRYPHEERILWIDALCINQSDHEERNHQVQMMSHIYSRAKQVCIWLGEDTDDSTKAIAFIRDIIKLEDSDALVKTGDASKWQSLLLLMQRPWFSRRWVVQEISLARTATMYCGNDKIPWTSFAVAVELFVEVETTTHRLSEVMRKDETFGHVPQWFEHISELGASVLVQATGKVFRRDGNQVTDLEEYIDSIPRPRSRKIARKGLKRKATQKLDRPSRPSALVPQRPLLSLEYLVSSLSVFQATQPRDAVYSLLAISRDTAPFAELRTKSQEGSEEAIIMSIVSSFLERKPFRVDYSRAYSDVCKDFISFCIQISGRSDPTRALDILCRPWAPEPEVAAGGVVHRKPTLYKYSLTHERESLWPVGRTRRPTFQVFARYHHKDIICQIKEPEQRIGAPMLRESDTRDKDAYWKDCEEDWESNGLKRRLTFEKDVAPFLPKKRKPPKQFEAEGAWENFGASGESESEDERQNDNEEDEQEKDIPLPSWVSRISGASFALYRQAGMHKLGRIGRVNADPLVGLPQDGHKSYSAAQNTKVDYDSERRLRFRKRPISGHCSLFTDGFILAKIDVVAEPARLGTIPETWMKIAGWENPLDSQTDPPVELWRTLVADGGKDGRNAPYYYATAFRESVRKGGLRGGSVDTGALINSERNSIVTDFCRRVQAVIWNRCLIKTNQPLNVLGLASQHVHKGDLICIIFGCSVPIILRRFSKQPGDLEKEKMQDQIESMKAAMAICEEACFRKLRHQKRLQEEYGKSKHFGELWKEEVLAEMEEVNHQIKRWREWNKEDEKRKEAQDKEQEVRKKNAELRQVFAKKRRAGAIAEPLQRKSTTMPTPHLRSMSADAASGLADERIIEDSEEVETPQSVLPQADGQDGQDGARETKKNTPEQLDAERQRKKKEAKEEDPNVYYKFMGEAYIQGMMDGEAVRLHIKEGIPRRMFELR